MQTVNVNTSAPRSLIVAFVALFFIWGGLTSLNDVLIPKLKGLFSLSFTEAMLTQFAFFMAYFLVSLPAGILVSRAGYLKGIVIGLGTMAAGCLLFIPASSSGIYATFLAALFVLASGITILQVAANPLIASLGSDATASSRLTLAQAFNSLGTTIFPPVGGAIILGSIGTEDVEILSGAEKAAFIAREASVISEAYIVIAGTLVFIALFFLLRRTQLPALTLPQASSPASFDIRKEKKLLGGVVSIFLYVGAEVAIGSMLINYLAQPSIMGVSEMDAARLIALYWGGAMVGRFIGAGLLRLFSPGVVLAGFCLGACLLIGLSAFTQGHVAGYALLAVGLMNSIMFPTIFSLGVEGLGANAPKGSGLLCMGIVGGAIIPLVLGSIADAFSLTIALIVPVACYLLIAGYGWSMRRRVGEPTLSQICIRPD